ncbi:hypothetical protein, partial [Methanocalculus sp.]|uniref:sodium:solute symporter family transporter n=1 Tax=Methanocalculus sp. TaxID=2004547 RepID=UPI002726585C
ILTWFAAWCGMGLGSIASLDISQRIFCARDDQAAKKGLIIGSALYWTAGLGPVFLGLIGIIMIQNALIEPSILADDPELIIPILAKILLEPWMMAIFVGSLVAAIMSTASSTIFASAAVLSTLWIKESVSDHAGEQKRVLKLTRYLVVAIGLFCIVISLFAKVLYDMMIFGFTLLFACLFWAIVCGLFWKRANAPGGLASMLTGFLTVIIGCIALSITEGVITIVPPTNEWLVFFTFVPALLSGLIMYGVTHATAQSHPPVPLRDTDGKILKWPELEDANR